MKYRILFSHTSFPAGGTERVTIDIANYLNQFGYESYIIASTLYPYAYPIKGVEIPQQKSIQTFEGRKFVVDYIKKEKIDFFILTMTPCCQLLKMIKEQTNCKTVFAHHSTPLFEKKFYLYHKKQWSNQSIIKKFIYHLLIQPKIKWFHVYDKKFLKPYWETYQYADAFTVLCDTYKKNWENYLKLSTNNKIVVISNSEQSIATPKLNKKKQIIYSGRLSNGDKQVDKILLIWKKIAHKIPDWELILIGDGPDAAQLKELCITWNLPRVTFTGYVSNVAPFYEQASILCLTSAIEGWGLCLTEAQAHGVVPIAFDCSAGVHQILSPSGTNGILIKPQNIKQFTKQLLRVVQDEKVRKDIQRNIVKKSKEYNIEKTGQKWLDLLENIK